MKAVVAERERVARRPRRACPCTCGRRAPTSSCSGPHARDGHDVWQALLERAVLVRDCSSWPRLDGCLRVTIGTRAEDDAFLAALAEVLA